MENKEPRKSWYKAMNQLTAKRFMNNIRKELEAKPHLLKELNNKVESFIVWAGFERLNYEADIDEEVKDFLANKFSVRLRLYTINASEWKRRCSVVFKRDNYICQHCGEKGGFLEGDHIIPFIKGGSDEIENIITSCRKCNRSRRDKSVEEFNEWKNKQSLNS